MKLIRTFSCIYLMFFLGNLYGQNINLKSALVSGTTTYNTYQQFNWTGDWTKSIFSYYTRNSNGNVTIKLTNSWNASLEDYENSQKETYTYNASYKVTTYLVQTWSTVDGILDWTNFSRTVYTYNTSGTLASTSFYKWKMVNSKYIWANSSRYLYTYNVQNLKTEDRFQLQKQDTLWNDTTKTIYNYDAKGNNIELTFQNWKSTVWENIYHHLYKYNTANKAIEDIYQNWDKSLTTPAWENKTKTAYGYDSKNRHILVFSSNWNKVPALPVWDTNAKDTLTYNAKGWLYLHYNYLGSPKAWLINYTITDYYDGYGNITEEIYKNSKGKQTNKSYKYIRSFDVEENMISQIYQTWDEINLRYNNLTKEVYSDYQTYAAPIMGIQNQQTSMINLFPNPVTDNVTINMNDAKDALFINISDINGLKVYEGFSPSNPTSINMKELPSGIYFISVQSGNNRGMEKIIKE